MLLRPKRVSLRHLTSQRWTRPEYPDFTFRIGTRFGWRKERQRASSIELNVAVTDALADPAVVRRLAELGQEIVPRNQQTPEALGAFQNAEINKWWPVVKAANIKAD